MNLSLTPELEQFVTEKVKQGLYPCASEVVSDGLRRLIAEEEHQRKHAELRREILSGIEQAERGETVPFNEETSGPDSSGGPQPSSGQEGRRE